MLPLYLPWISIMVHPLCSSRQRYLNQGRIYDLWELTCGPSDVASLLCLPSAPAADNSHWNHQSSFASPGMLATPLILWATCGFYNVMHNQLLKQDFFQLYLIIVNCTFELLRLQICKQHLFNQYNSCANNLSKQIYN